MEYMEKKIWRRGSTVETECRSYGWHKRLTVGKVYESQEKSRVRGKENGGKKLLFVVSCGYLDGYQ